MKRRNISLTVVLSSAIAVLPWSAIAANATPAPSATAGAVYAVGEVKKIDVSQGKITLKHGPIDNLGMPGMTMVFRADPAVLASVKVGDQVKFKADKVDGSIKVTELVKSS
ncbi:MAG: copper-binding protein [Roseateles sp.]|uniref:copper-binding protein n=1 Tax=Roseateles sp. TaxID=1971397 RepID=UPI0040351E55